MLNATITGTGMHVPPRVVTNDDLANDYGIDTSHEWIVKRTGIEERRFAEEGIGTSDLALEATKMALEDAGLEAHDLDLIVFATLSPEYQFPGSGVFLQEKLGLCEGDNAKFVPALDIRNQCSGFIYGLAHGWDWVRAARMGNACGAIVVTRHGCANFMGYEEEVLRFVEKRGGF